MEIANNNVVTKAGRKEWLGLLVLALPTLIVSMDFTVTYLAVPAISADLKPSSSQLLWITDIYGFLQAGLLIVVGTLGDRIGRRRILLIGALAFGLASVGAAYSTSTGMLILCRAFLGIAGSTLLPSTISLIRNMFHDEKQRTLAFGAYTTCFSLGTMLGPLAGGILLAHFWWGSVFLLGVPFMVILLVAGPVFLPEYKNPASEKFDVLSAFLLIVGILSITYGIKQFAEIGITPVVGLTVIGGLIIGFIFLRRQKNVEHPLVDPTLFRSPVFRAALLALMIGLFSWAGILLFTTQYLQLILGMSPLTAGLWTIPSAVASLIGCSCAPYTMRLLGKGRAIITGIFFIALGMFAFTCVERSFGFFMVMTGTVLISLGCSTIVTLGIDMVVSSAPPEKAGVAAGISETSTGLGSALGIALLGSLGTFIYRRSFSDTLMKDLSASDLKTARGTLGGAVEGAHHLQNANGAALLESAHHAFTIAFTVTAIIAGAAILILAFILGNKLKSVKST